MSDIPGIDDVAPAGGNDLPLSGKTDLAGVPLRLEDVRDVTGGKFANDEWCVHEAVRLDTGEKIAFAGATVLDKQAKTCRDKGLYPPIGAGVKAVLVKHVPDDGGNEYWKFVSPDAAPRVDAAQNLVNLAAERTAEVKRFIDAGIPSADVRSFVDAMIPGGRVQDLSDEQYGTLLEYLREKESEAVPF